ncbi:hypothetical protein B296_00030624 [Ensete ventricosum]|uniref:Uncharacterized protein n=1 Tax=Ensete ventricosum TaxID=4639 RepID=A0A426YXD6_ENSVE|nr:hypothetical protein B296_00030624 [Ensete ventricosum]
MSLRLILVHERAQSTLDPTSRVGGSWELCVNVYHGVRDPRVPLQWDAIYGSLTHTRSRGLGCDGVEQSPLPQRSVRQLGCVSAALLPCCRRTPGGGARVDLSAIPTNWVHAVSHQAEQVGASSERKLRRVPRALVPMRGEGRRRRRRREGSGRDGVRERGAIGEGERERRPRGARQRAIGEGEQ